MAGWFRRYGALDILVVTILIISDLDALKQRNRHPTRCAGAVQGGRGAVSGEYYPGRTREGNSGTAAHPAGVFPARRRQVPAQGENTATLSQYKHCLKSVNTVLLNKSKQRHRQQR